MPSAIDDHQTANAASLASVGGAWPMPQPTFTPEALAARLTELLADPTALSAASDAARTQARPNAAAALADLAESLISGENRV